MTDRLKVISGLIAVGVAIFIFFVWQHGRDERARGKLDQLQQQVKRDSTARVAAEAKVDTVTRLLAAQIPQAKRTDTLWRTKSEQLPGRIDTLLASGLPDTTKIDSLVTIVKDLKATGDSNANQCRETIRTCEQLKIDIAGERKNWQQERDDLAQSLATAKKLIKHWGLGGTCGYGGVFSQGLVRTGPGCAVGLTYRW